MLCCGVLDGGFHRCDFGIAGNFAIFLSCRNNNGGNLASSGLLQRITGPTHSDPTLPRTPFLSPDLTLGHLPRLPTHPAFITL